MALAPDEAEYVLKGILTRQERLWRTIMAPYFAELTLISARKPPRPVQMPDGTTAVYCGPTADDLGGPYRAPEWLEEMCRNLSDEMADLRRYRERFTK